MSLAAAINTTPHDIVYYADGKAVKTFPKAVDSLRLTSAETEAFTNDGMPVVSAPKFTGVVGTLPPGPILVSMPVGNFLATTGRKEVFGPDTGPESVVRDDKGQIIGCKRFVQYA